MASRLTASPAIVEWFAGNEGYRCGYCKREDTNFSHGMWAHAMTVDDYQDLVDRGWRRSGKYCYKPTMNVTCCPHYTIRCDAPQFKLTNSQKKVLKRVNRFLIKGDKSGDNSGTMETGLTPSSSEDAGNPPTSTHLPTDSPKKTFKTKIPGQRTQLSDNATEKVIPKKGTGADPNKPVCRKAKDIRKERKLQKLVAKSESAELKPVPTSTCIKSSKKSNEPKSLEDFLDEPSKVENPAHRLEIKLIRSSPPSQEFVKRETESYKVFESYQTTIHKEKPEDTTLSGYKQFLVDSPLRVKQSEKLADGYGSYHQHYILDGKLIAIGVVDILTHCVSSVYMYYNPDYDFLSLGTYTALQELAFTRKLHKMEPQIKFYYMGFYIHNCPKMKYKGQYYPSYLLCPETYTWQPIEKCLPKLDKSNYSRLDEDPKKEDECGKIDVEEVLVLHKSTMMTYKQYRQRKETSEDRDDVLQYAGFVGKTCAQRMLLYRQ